MSKRPREVIVDVNPPRSGLKYLVALFVVFLLFSAAMRLYIDQLWFESLGFESVYWYGISAQAVAFGLVFVLTATVLWVNLRLIIAAGGDTRRWSFLQIQGRSISAPPPETFRRVATLGAIGVGLVIGVIFSYQWATYALYVNQPPPGAVMDPVFGRSLEWYLFSLPLLEIVSVWLSIIAVLTALAAIAYFILGMTVQFRGISIAAAVAMIALAYRAWLYRYNLLLEDHSLFSGVTYVGDRILATSLPVLSIALLAGAGLAAVNLSGRLRNLIVAAAVPLAVCVIGVVLLPWYTRTFVVRPNELVRETPYIRHNIEFTRKAFGLDRVEEVPFEARETGVGFKPDDHRPTLDNLRLWDWKALQDTLRQMQTIQTYYDFADVDIDRYRIGGKTTGTMVATRELDINRIGQGSRNWVNDRLIYTHGYGVVMNSASRFTREGLPEFILSDMPVKNTVAELQIKRPEIYFGELTNWPVYAKTSQAEFNYPEAQGTYSYGGTGGIRIGSFFRRLLLAYEVGDLLTVPFSNDITPDSVLLHRRNIIERASLLAPFLTYDDDPYMVVGRDGALYWMIDAYTSSGRYPYSRHIRVGNRSINYIRNSVKAVIDAYNGRVTFYVFDAEDPLIAAYQRVFPDLFRPNAEMPDFLREHVRYPELLFQIQAVTYSAYHVDSEQIFYNREDVWTVAQQGRAQTGSQAAETIEPYFVLMSFGGKDDLEFVSILPFTPAKRNNLIGWLAARSDGENYGKLRTYHLPRTRFVDGPLQIQSKIDQDPQLSSQLSLWNQQGSAVIRGNLLVIPIEDTLLFVEPIYLQAQRSPMPALRLIVLATQDRLAYATTFEEALKLLVEGRPGSLTQIPGQTPGQTQTPPTTGPPSAAGSPEALIQRANQALAEYQQLTAAGRLAEAGARLEQLKAVLEELGRTR